jgi:hypothetical protein
MPIFQHNTIVLRNSDDEITFADFSCRVKGNQKPTDEEVRNRISDAVEAWRKGTDAGDRAWTYTSEDFNIGDLTSYLDDEDLLDELKDRGIYRINIDIHSFDAYQPTPWSFDDILGK